MLPLQLKSLLPKLPRKTIFLAKLVFFSATLHLIFFLALMMVESWRLAHIVRLHDISDGAAVVLVPLIKTITPHAQTRAPAKEARAQPTTQIAKELPPKKSQDPQKKKEPEKKLPTPEPQQKSVKKEAEKKPDIKKEETKKIEPLVQAQPSQKMPPMIDTATTTTTLQQVGHYDLALITLCNEIKAGIAKTWRRPTNIPSTEQCHVKVCVRSETERMVTIVKSSRALALDIMVKNFVAQYPFPRALWHTEIELIF
jgi:outer membrane biosynthesis protein TonB